MNARVLAVLGAVALVAVFLLVRGCEDPEENLVRASLEAMVDAVERRDADGLAAYIAADYGDRFGHDDVSVVRRVIDEVEHYPEVRITLAHLDIEVEEKSRQADVRFLPEFAGEVDLSRKTRPKYEFEKGQRVRLRMRKQGDRYVVERAEMGVSISGAL